MCNDKVQRKPTGVSGCGSTEDKIIGKRRLKSILANILEGTFLCVLK
jgi:hypothetical protein